jgi:hypothetical protein
MSDNPELDELTDLWAYSQHMIAAFEQVLAKPDQTLVDIAKCNERLTFWRDKANEVAAWLEVEQHFEQPQA